ALIVDVRDRAPHDAVDHGDDRGRDDLEFVHGGQRTLRLVWDAWMDVGYLSSGREPVRRAIRMHRWAMVARSHCSRRVRVPRLRVPTSTKPPRANTRGSAKPSTAPPTFSSATSPMSRNANRW